MATPKLVQIAPEMVGSTYIAVDDTGEVWKGRLERDQGNREYIAWTPLRSEFPRGR
jgi:hypothetical protein